MFPLIWISAIYRRILVYDAVYDIYVYHKNPKHQIYPTKTGVYVHSLILRAKTEVSDRKNFVFSFFVIIA
jgi:hypothetical protein